LRHSYQRESLVKGITIRKNVVDSARPVSCTANYTFIAKSIQLRRQGRNRSCYFFCGRGSCPKTGSHCDICESVTAQLRVGLGTIDTPGGPHFSRLLRCGVSCVFHHAEMIMLSTCAAHSQSTSLAVQIRLLDARQLLISCRLLSSAVAFSRRRRRYNVYTTVYALHTTSILQTTKRPTAVGLMRERTRCFCAGGNASLNNIDPRTGRVSQKNHAKFSLFYAQMFRLWAIRISVLQSLTCLLFTVTSKTASQDTSYCAGGAYLNPPR